MARIRVLAENPPPPRGYVEDQLRELRDYITRLKDELEFLLTHLGTDNMDRSLNTHLDRMKEQLEAVPMPSDELPKMDGEPTSGESAGISRADHRHPTDTKLWPRILASYFTVLYEFTGTISTTVTLPEDAERYQLLAFQMFDSNRNMINAVTLPPKAFRNTVVKIYGSSSSQWGSFKLETDDGTGLLTKCTFNRTTANTALVRVLGIGKVA